MQVTDKRVLIISADHFEDSELLQPYLQLVEEGINVDIASFERGTITGKHGAEVNANIAINEVKPDEYALLLLPGGKAPAALRKEQQVLNIAKRFFDEKKHVAAICHGPQILISSGVMAGRTATAYPSVANELKEAGANYQDKAVVIDRNLITSRRPGDIPSFMREVLHRLKSPKD